MNRFLDILLVLIIESMLGVVCLGVMITLNEFSIVIRFVFCVPLAITGIFAALAILKD